MAEWNAHQNGLHCTVLLISANIKCIIDSALTISELMDSLCGIVSMHKSTKSSSITVHRIDDNMRRLQYRVHVRMYVWSMNIPLGKGV